MTEAARGGAARAMRDRLTECGRQVSDVKAVITFDEAEAKARRIGKQRMAFSTCMTCATRARRDETWSQMPIAVVARYCERYHYYGRFHREDPVGQRIEAELRAHPEEFEQAMEAMSGTTSLDTARREKQQRRTS